MFLAIVFIAIGLAILLSTLGIINGTFWGLFWAIFFVAVGLKILMKGAKCPMCNWGSWHEQVHGECCGKDCCEKDCCDEDCCIEEKKK